MAQEIGLNLPSLHSPFRRQLHPKFQIRPFPNQNLHKWLGRFSPNHPRFQVRDWMRSGNRLRLFCGKIPRLNPGLLKEVQSDRPIGLRPSNAPGFQRKLAVPPDIQKFANPNLR